ncbi:hypothetical protein [Paenibacillus sanguinis]|uniref:hypothetical protein n=1 Tax=Paenibacillus sanguinis TaxID=225906 RepID=UPI0003816F52|nr:hypothetical protein [Paenibacillus sanguinis]
MPYIQVNNSGIVYAISDSQVIPVADNIFEVDSFDSSYLGKRRLADGTFEDVPLPESSQESDAK